MSWVLAGLGADGKRALGIVKVMCRDANLMQVVRARSTSRTLRADCTAGSISATRMPTMAITTNNSTSVKPPVRIGWHDR